MNEHNRNNHNMSPVPENLIKKFKKTKKYEFDVELSKNMNEFKIYGMTL